VTAAARLTAGAASARMRSAGTGSRVQLPLYAAGECAAGAAEFERIRAQRTHPMLAAATATTGLAQCPLQTGRGNSGWDAVAAVSKLSCAQNQVHFTSELASSSCYTHAPVFQCYGMSSFGIGGGGNIRPKPESMGATGRRWGRARLWCNSPCLQLLHSVAAAAATVASGSARPLGGRGGCVALGSMAYAQGGKLI
jgi:hypothetical protein